MSCAGIAHGERTLGRDGAPHDLDAFERVVRINLVGTFNVLRVAAAAMARHEPLADGERGVIVNTASIAAYEGQIGQAAYAASKAGVVGLTITTARDLASVGVRVCTVAPGTFETPMVASLPEPARAALADSVPFPGRLGAPEEYRGDGAHDLRVRRSSTGRRSGSTGPCGCRHDEPSIVYTNLTSVDVAVDCRPVIDFATAPDRYRHWRLELEPPIAPAS